MASSGYASQMASSGDDSVILAAHKYTRAKLDGDRSWMALTEWGVNDDGEDYIVKVWSAKVGHDIKGVKIEKGVWYWFEDNELKSEEG